MQAIVLAAGKGSRLKERTKEVPKPLIEVGGNTLLGWNVKRLLAAGASSVIVVTGYLHEQIEKFLEEYFVDKPVRHVYNEDFEKGSVLTVLTAKPYITEGFVLANADHLFPQKAYKKLMEETKDITVGVFNNRAAKNDEMKVLQKNATTELSKTFTEYTYGYTGLTSVADECVEAYFSLAEEIVEQLGDHIVPENLILPLSKQLPINICDLSQYAFLEVDDEKDFLFAEKNIGGLENNNR